MTKVMYDIKERQVRGFMRKRVYKPYIVRSKPCTKREFTKLLRSRLGVEIPPYLFEALADIILTNACYGRDTVLPGLGYFRLTMNGKNKKTPDFNRSDLGELGLKFKPDRQAMTLLNDANIVLCRKMPKC